MELQGIVKVFTPTLDAITNQMRKGLIQRSGIPIYPYTFPPPTTRALSISYDHSQAL